MKGRGKASRATATTLRIYCTCGAAWLSTPTEMGVYAKMLREFTKAHTGTGHRLCDAKTAACARRKAEAGEQE